MNHEIRHHGSTPPPSQTTPLRQAQPEVQATTVQATTTSRGHHNGKHNRDHMERTPQENHKNTTYTRLSMDVMNASRQKNGTFRLHPLLQQRRSNAPFVPPASISPQGTKRERNHTHGVFHSSHSEVSRVNGSFETAAERSVASQHLHDPVQEQMLVRTSFLISWH